jgi:hypothetical protein
MLMEIYQILKVSGGTFVPIKRGMNLTINLKIK